MKIPMIERRRLKCIYLNITQYGETIECVRNNIEFFKEYPYALWGENVLSVITPEHRDISFNVIFTCLLDVLLCDYSDDTQLLMKELLPHFTLDMIECLLSSHETKYNSMFMSYRKIKMIGGEDGII